jgi:formate hydrogenlyase subunit 4
MSASILLGPIAALLLSPLFAGIVNRVKAIVAGRRGAPLLQAYFDLFRLFNKDSVFSTTTSWVFRAAPVIIFGATLAATCLVPVRGNGALPIGVADLVLLLSLLALARFFLILSALDTGSAFEGMGASREAFFSALAEPALFLCLLNVLRTHGAESLGRALGSPLAAQAAMTAPVTTVLTGVALFIVLLAENARIPVDDPTTHLELTMIHEAMILDNSGPGLALVEYGAAIKLWLFALILAHVLLPLAHLPHGTGTVALLCATGLIAVLVGLVESVMARLRLVKVPQLLFGAGVIALMGFFISVTGALIG